MKRTLLLLLCSLVFIASGFTQTDNLPPSDIDYPDFLEMTGEVGKYRQSRLVTLDNFLEMAKDPGTIILDTRSKEAYKGKHLAGAIHLNFSDFSTPKLEKVIPSKTTRILIYCNNNLEGDEVHFARKSAPLALNIPTFINLYGYGYENIYELADLIPVDHPALHFEGSAVVLNDE